LVLTQNDLEQYLLDAIDLFEGKLEIVERRDYLLSLFFYKRLCDQFEEDLLNVTGDPEDPDNYNFYIPETARWNKIRAISEGIGGAIDDAFKEIEEFNQDLLSKVLTPVQFNNPNILSDRTLSKLIIHLSKDRYNLKNSNLEHEKVVGNAFRSLIKYFADYEGKKVSYTPQAVIKILTGILNPEEKMRICDPACGSGGMLIGCVEHLKEKGRKPKDLTLFGQEKKITTWSIGRMNLFFHDILDANVKYGDTFKDPIFDEYDMLRQYSLILTNPIWNDPEWDKDFFKDGDPHGRLDYGIPPSSDWCWIQHILATLDDKGRAGIVLDNGALFRGRKEGEIRESVIEDDLIEAVVALPPKIFYKNSGPGCLIIINKNKPSEIKRKIFFIHAENEFEEGKAQNLMKDEHVNKIINAFKEKKSINKFSDLIDLEEIKENDYNLNVSRYIDILPDEEPIDLDKIIKETLNLIEKRTELENKWKKDMKELGFEHF